jgi:ankyrin repeat protein
VLGAAKGSYAASEERIINRLLEEKIMKPSQALAFVWLFLSACIVSAQEDLTSELMAAAGNGETAEVKTLLDRGANVNARDSYGFTALIFAAKSGNSSTVRLLLTRGADVNAKSKLLGYTALMNAAAFGNEEMVGALIAQGAVVNVRNDDGVTALSFAEQAGKPGIIKLLKAHGGTK